MGEVATPVIKEKILSADFGYHDAQERRISCFKRDS